MFQLLGRGLGTRQIAEELRVGIKTVESYRARIKEKLQLIGIRATADPERVIQFDVVPVTKESTMPVERLARRQAISLKKSFY